MKKILNFEDFQAKLKVDEESKAVAEQQAAQAQQSEADKNVIEENETFDAADELNAIEETELPELFKDYEEITEAEFQVTEPKLEGDAIVLKINNQKYKFAAPAATDGKTIDIKEIFRKFEKMMGFAKAGGKALAWLHKQLGKGEKIA